MSQTPSPRTFPWRCVTVVWLAVATVSCSWSAVVYERLDWLAMSQVDDHFDLSWSEERSTKPQVQHWVSWAKQELTPSLLDLAKDVRASSAAPWTPAQVAGYWDRLTDMRRALLERMAPEAAAFLKARSDEQLAHVCATLRAKDDKARDLLALKEGYAHAYDKKILAPRLKPYDTWFGGLTDSQKAMLSERWREDEATLRERLAQREDMCQAFVAAVKASSVPVLTEKIRAWAHDPALLLPPARRAAYHGKREEFAQALSALSATLSDAQRKAFRAKAEEAVGVLRAWVAKSQK